jgi:hypothetical protein
VLGHVLMKLELFERGSNFGSFALILAKFIRWNILERLQVVGPYLKCAASCVSSKEIVTSVPRCQLVDVAAL